MLRQLSIQNYAIIDFLRIDFSEKLNIITGETGAGKSIIVGALGLILGERADTGVLVNKEKKCIVEGVFDVGGKTNLKKFLQSEELDEQDELVVRREINPNGKSRAFINDTPVTLSQLAQLSGMLVDLHQQFDTLALGSNDFQREVVDALAGNSTLLEQYRELYVRLQDQKTMLNRLRDQKQAFNKELDYNQFQFNELQEANFGEHELENIAAELKLLANSEGIKATLSAVNYELQESEAPIVQQIKKLHHQLSSYSDFHAGIPILVSRLQSLQVELQDVADEVERISNHISYDPSKIEQLNDRLSNGYKLQKKHGVQTTAELIQVQLALEAKLQAVLNIDEEISAGQKNQAVLESAASELAAKISAAREKQVKPLETKVNKLLKQVGMPNAALKVDIRQVELNGDGMDAIEFLFDANKSGQLQPLRKVASGGELSRLMLSVKSLVAESIDLPTMIFDEIDSGISGEAARQVGLIMKELAAKRQVISITHQPQIAGKADAHFFVYKEIVKNEVKTNIRKLDLEERIIAVAKMLSGEKPTAAAMDNAREMVRN
jgi:DNA repair protein RecN (Recombination protein N)